MLSVDSKLDLASQNIVQIFELILRALMLTNLISECSKPELSSMIKIKSL